MSKNKYVATAMLAGSMFLTVGCTATQEDSSTKETTVFSTKEDSTSLVGKVSKIEGYKITIKVGTLNMGQGSQNGERPEIPNGERPEMPEGVEMSENMKKPSGERPEGSGNGKGGEMITLTGEEEVITISSDIKIVRISGGRGESNSEEVLSISDIKVDDIIKINYNENKTSIESIEIMSFGEMKTPNGKSNNESNDKLNENKEEAVV